MGARYGAIQTPGLSATHEEYREVRERCSVLVMVQGGVEREDGQTRRSQSGNARLALALTGDDQLMWRGQQTAQTRHKGTTCPR